MSPLGALLLFGVMLPVALLFAFSFFHLHLLEVVPGATIDNYHRVVTTTLYRKYAFNALLIAAPTAFLALVGGYVLAYYLAIRARHPRILLVAIVIALMGSYLAFVFRGARSRARAASSTRSSSSSISRTPRSVLALLSRRGRHGGGQLLPTFHNARALLEPGLDLAPARCGRPGPRGLQVDDAAPRDAAALG